MSKNRKFEFLGNRFTSRFYYLLFLGLNLQFRLESIGGISHLTLSDSLDKEFFFNKLRNYMISNQVCLLYMLGVTRRHA